TVPEMAAEVTPDTVERERFGSLLADVTHVSAFPVSLEAAASTIGSGSVALAVTGGTPMVEVRMALRPDPSTFSGFAWSSSRGPRLKVSAGTTATVQVTLEERAPITYVMPFLRSFFEARDPTLAE
ncbi:MAG TPA: NHLP bacteriocin system secretion protein, partial [Planctomycetota bacterium]|nr:NHLP bacteriocin system secretion protein [Planctomycetota bacterium]